MLIHIILPLLAIFLAVPLPANLARTGIGIGIETSIGISIAVGIATGPRPVAAALKPGAINFGWEEEDWHRTCFPCYGNAGLWNHHLLHLGCSKNGSTNTKHFTTYTEVDLDQCVTNFDGQLNNRDDNDSPANGHHQNLHFSESCYCVLHWQFLNGSMTCYCDKFNKDKEAEASTLPFKGVLFNDGGRAGCLFGAKRVYGKQMNGCPTKKFTRTLEW